MKEPGGDNSSCNSTKENTLHNGRSKSSVEREFSDSVVEDTSIKNEEVISPGNKKMENEVFCYCSLHSSCL